MSTLSTFRPYQSPFKEFQQPLVDKQRQTKNEKWARFKEKMISDEERQAALTKMARQEFGINMNDFCVKNSNVRTANFDIFDE